jgi:hypothetical protein
MIKQENRKCKNTLQVSNKQKKTRYIHLALNIEVPEPRCTQENKFN